MKHQANAIAGRTAVTIWSVVMIIAISVTTVHAQETPLCLDGFCIGQTIQDVRFDKADWVQPKKDLMKDECTGVGCRPENAFRGYPHEEQVKLADAFSWKYGLNSYNVITKANLATLRKYQYECNTSARGLWGERRIFGAYRSVPSHYLTVVGLRLIEGKLTVYRIARQYPYQNQNELITLGRQLGTQYGTRVLLYDYLSSNAYSDVIEQRKEGWFARSSMFNPTDLSDNAAELVLIDPRTRALLEPTSMPDSGDIKPLPVRLSPSCNRSLPVQ
jgi:hypothetical protein